MNVRIFLHLAAVGASFVLAGCGTVPESSSASRSAATAQLPLDTTTVSSAALPDSADPGGYVLGRGDLIGIQVFDEPDLTLDVRVGSSGVVNYSYLGDVRVAGKTPLELERHIAELLRGGYLVNPSVNITVKQFRPFFISGEVRSPGSYPYQPGLTLDKAITLAGGLTDRASSRRMYVVRAGADDTDPQRILLGAKLSPGDTISIEEGFF